MHANGKEDEVERSDAAPKAIDPSLADTSGDSEVKLDETAQLLIGLQLKAVYREIIHQPIPDQLMQLLDELERKERDR